MEFDQGYNGYVPSDSSSATRVAESPFRLSESLFLDHITDILSQVRLELSQSRSDTHSLVFRRQHLSNTKGHGISLTFPRCLQHAAAIWLRYAAATQLQRHDPSTKVVCTGWYAWDGRTCWWTVYGRRPYGGTKSTNNHVGWRSLVRSQWHANT